MALSSVSSPKQPEWPAERDYAAYNHMCGGRLDKMIRKGRIKVSESVVDIGPGKFCSALQEISHRVKGAALYAIAPHKPEAIPPAVTFLSGFLPDVKFPPKSVKLITDIFSGVSYATRLEVEKVIPIGHEVLIRLAGWLKPGGVLVACTEVKRLGNSGDHRKISEFFRDYMGLTCRFETYEKFAESNQVLENQLRITVKNKQTLKKLIKKAGALFPCRKESAFLWHLPYIDDPYHRCILGKDVDTILSPYEAFLCVGGDVKKAETFAAKKKLQWVSIHPSRVFSDPENMENFGLGKMNLIVDLFECVANAEEKGVEVLVMLALQLAPKGQLIVCTHLMSFGTPSKDWNALSHFFRSEMGLSCTIESFQLNQSPDLYARVIIERKQAYEDLVELAISQIGVPSAGKVLWESKEKEPADRIRIYETIFSPVEREEEPLLLSPSSEVESEALEETKKNYRTKFIDQFTHIPPEDFLASRSFQ